MKFDVCVWWNKTNTIHYSHPQGNDGVLRKTWYFQLIVCPRKGERKCCEYVTYCFGPKHKIKSKISTLSLNAGMWHWDEYKIHGETSYIEWLFLRSVSISGSWNINASAKKQKHTSSQAPHVAVWLLQFICRHLSDCFVKTKTLFIFTCSRHNYFLFVLII